MSILKFAAEDAYENNKALGAGKLGLGVGALGAGGVSAYQAKKLLNSASRHAKVERVLYPLTIGLNTYGMYDGGKRLTRGLANTGREMLLRQAILGVKPGKASVDMVKDHLNTFLFDELSHGAMLAVNEVGHRKVMKNILKKQHNAKLKLLGAAASIPVGLGLAYSGTKDLTN